MEPPQTVSITDVAYRGNGVARLADGCAVFVPGTLPGETADIEIVQWRKNYAQARLLRVPGPSEHRIAPACPWNDRCPGCCYQHVRYEEEVRLKQNQLVSLLQRIARVQEPVCLPPIPSPTPLEYRNKIVLHAARDGNKPWLGYYAVDNESILDIPSCPLAARPLNALLQERREDGSFLEALQPPLRVTFRWTQPDGALQWLRRVPAGLDRCRPEGWLTEDTSLGSLRVPRGSFFQVNTGAADLLVAELDERLQALRPDYVLDLYCGVGVFALAAARHGIPNITGADTDEAAILAARVNADMHGRKEIRFVAASAEAALKALPFRRAGANALLVLDPPRMGLTRNLLRQIRQLAFPQILYVSCAADTLARDLRGFQQAGYQVCSTRLVDMFPRTPYFETLTRLEL